MNSVQLGSQSNPSKNFKLSILVKYYSLLIISVRIFNTSSLFSLTNVIIPSLKNMFQPQNFQSIPNIFSNILRASELSPKSRLLQSLPMRSQNGGERKQAINSGCHIKAYTTCMLRELPPFVSHSEIKVVRNVS